MPEKKNINKLIGKHFQFDNLFLEHPLKCGFIDLYQIGELCCESNFEIEEHEQYLCEITYVISGEGTAYTDNKTARLYPGVVVVNSPGHLHKIVTAGNSLLRFAYMGFMLNKGADGIQLYAVEGEMAPENLTDTDIREHRRFIEDNGLTVSAVCGDLGGHGFTRAEENPLKIERSKRIVDLALKLGTNIITTHIGVVPEDETSYEYSVLHNACEELARYAHSAGAFLRLKQDRSRRAG